MLRLHCGGAALRLQPRQVGSSHEGSVSNLTEAKAVCKFTMLFVSKVNHCKIVFLIYL